MSHAARHLALQPVQPVQVALWHQRLPDVLPRNAAEMLDVTEARRALSMPNAKLRTRYIAAHVALRRVLGAQIGQDPARVRFGAGPHGKPSLPEVPDLRFNMSHSGDHLAIAVSHETEIGVDIELRRPNSQARRIVSRLFAAEEKAALAGVSGDAFNDAFARLWVMKEAFIKADGRGLALPFRDFAICPFEPRILRVPKGSPDRPSVFYQQLGEGVDCAIVAAGASDRNTIIARCEVENNT